MMQKRVTKKISYDKVAILMLFMGNSNCLRNGLCMTGETMSVTSETIRLQTPPPQVCRVSISLSSYGQSGKT